MHIKAKKKPEAKRNTSSAASHDECKFCLAVKSGDREVIDTAIANGEAFEMSDEQVAYFRDHLKPEQRCDYDAIEKAEGKIAALAFTLEKVLRESMPNFKVYQPVRRLQ
jgi:hypothetical protein